MSGPRFGPPATGLIQLNESEKGRKVQPLSLTKAIIDALPRRGRNTEQAEHIEEVEHTEQVEHSRWNT